MKKIIITIALFLFVISCHKDEESFQTDGNGVVISLSYQWQNFKTNAVYVFEATATKPAKIVVLTHLHAYCFEAAR